jgi:hypothetical protein
MNAARRVSGFAPVLILVIFALVGLGAFIFTSNLNKPARVKQKAELVSPLFRDYANSLEDVIAHLEEEPASDVDSIERYLQKGKDFLKTAEENQENLNSQINKLNITDLSDYKKGVNDYIDKSKEVLSIHKDNLDLLEKYIPSLQDYEQLTVNLSGVSNYLYSDPAKYVSEVDKAIKSENEILSDIKTITPSDLMSEYHENFIKTLENERDLLTQLRDAARDRNNAALTTAMRAYGEKAQENSRETNRIKDELDDIVKNLSDELDDIIDNLEREYDDLKEKFDF